MPRRDGKTYRLLLRTLLAASATPHGKFVVVAGQAVAARYIFDMLNDLVAPVGAVRDVNQRWKVTLPNGSTVQVITMDRVRTASEGSGAKTVYDEYE